MENENSYSRVNSVILGLFFIVGGVFTYLYPILTKNKFGFGAPGNEYLGIAFVIVGILITYISYRKLSKTNNIDE